MRWLVSQTDGIFSQREVLNAKFAINYLHPSTPHQINDLVPLALRRDLTRNLGKTQQTVFDVLRQSLDEIIVDEDEGENDSSSSSSSSNSSSSWHEINLAKILQPAITNATNRILVGPNLCANETFMKAFGTFSDLLGIAAVVIGQYIPFFLAPPAGYLASFLVRFHRKKALRYLVPDVQARIHALQLEAKTNPKIDPALLLDDDNNNNNNKNNYKPPPPPPPADVIQWTVAACENYKATDISDAILSLVSSHSFPHLPVFFSSQFFSFVLLCKVVNFYFFIFLFFDKLQRQVN